MLLYHCHNIDIGWYIPIDFKNDRKCMKKDYKSADKQKYICYSSESVGGGESKKSRVLRKRKISKKNLQYLEGLGLKVKQKK